MSASIHAGKLAVVTGGAMGFGRAIAMRLAEHGADVVVADLHPAESIAEEIQKLGRRAFAAQCDISRLDDVASLRETIISKFGRCDILVNNVGIFATRSFDDTSFEHWRRTMSINLDSMFLMVKAFAPEMRGNGWGRIVNLASNTLGSMAPNHVDYIASKGGVVGFTRGLASEFGVDGVTINAIAPGLTETPGSTQPSFRPRGMAPADAFLAMASAQAIKRPQKPTDVAGVVSFLASDDAGFMTGQTLYVDGGLNRV